MARTLAEPIPVQPFIDWIDARLAEQDDGYASHATDKPMGPLEAVLALIGWTGEAGARRLHRWRTGDLVTGEVERGTVEDALEHAGHRFEDLYPDLVEDVELEPQAYCSHCRDYVHPIGGVCPWCDHSTADEKPTRRFCARCDTAMFPALNGGCWRCGGALAQIPWVACGCGCSEKFARFDAQGREITYRRGHAPRTLERTWTLPADPFAEWLRHELADLDPIQALQRRVGLKRQELLDLLNGRTDTVEFSRVRRTLWLAAREGQGKGVPPRPDAKGMEDVYPDLAKRRTCPRCGAGKAPQSEMCKTCRKRAGQKRGPASSVTDEHVAEARRLKAEGVSVLEIARRIQPRTRCENPVSVAQELGRRLREAA